MAYNELIKNFNRIRDYMREFYVYGFKSREEYNKKSARAYDDERRRMESWLGDNMGFRQTPEGKNMFISIDSRVVHNNPLYKAWKTKSFTDGDITLHFILMDILSHPDISMNIGEIMEEVGEFLSEFDNPRYFDESTIRKKLKEYVAEGIVTGTKQGKVMYYSRTETVSPENRDFLGFFSEVMPCGVVGSYLLDKESEENKFFLFKHHYITGAMDSEMMYELFDAIHNKAKITLEVINRRKDRITENQVIPLQIMLSAQHGRQYLMAYMLRSNRVRAFRIDNILAVKQEGICEDFDKYRKKYLGMLPHVWGISTFSALGKKMEHVDFTVTYDPEDDFIHKRLEREKRRGKVERLSEGSSRFSIDVYDSSELIPWIRTFICRITELNFSNKELEKQFWDDIDEMYKLYDMEGGGAE